MLKSSQVDQSRLWSTYEVRNIDFGLYLKTGQPVAHKRHGIFLFGFFCQRMHIFRYFICLSLWILEIELNKKELLHFFKSIFSSSQPAPVLNNAD